MGVRSAKIFLGVTESDELNIIACIIAKRLGSKDTIARVRKPEYSMNVNFMKENFGISMMINPEQASAMDILTTLKYPCAFNLENFLDNKVNLVELVVEENSPLENLMLKDYRLTKEKILICAVERDGEVTIPRGDFVLKRGDRFFVTGTSKALKEFITKCDYKNGIIKSVLIVGGSRIAFYLTKLLLEKKYSVKLFEIDPHVAEFLLKVIPK